MSSVMADCPDSVPPPQYFWKVYTSACIVIYWSLWCSTDPLAFYASTRQQLIRDIDELKKRLIVVWAELKRVSLTKLLNSGGQGWEPAFKRRDITSNILLN